MIINTVYRQTSFEHVAWCITATDLEKELYVASGATEDPELLRVLARSPEVSIRMRVAENPTPRYLASFFSRWISTKTCV